MKTILWRFAKWFLFSLLAMLLSYGVLAMVFSLWSTNPPKQTCSQDKQIYITTLGIHLDIVVPIDQVPAFLLHDAYINDSTTHLAFGWGERNFYLETPTWGDLTLGNAARALLINSEPVMHITRYRKVKNDWKPLKLCEEAEQALFRYIEDSFRKTTEQAWTEISSEGYSRHDFFFEATGRYNAINTCNTWLNNGMKSAGVKTSRWSPLTYGILYHLN